MKKIKNHLFINPKKETKKIINFLKKVQKQTGIKKVVLGLSGGIDSTTTLFLLKKAYKKENIFVLYLPYNLSFFKDKNFEEIKKIINLTKIPQENLFVVKLKNSADKIIDEMKVLGKKGLDRLICEIKECFTCPNTDYLNKVRVGNMLARLRMIFLFDTAKKINALVCGTENKSEKFLGYFTRFGDQASDIEPITHLYKTQIYQLAKFLRVPKEIIEKKPSANLWEGQTDEDELGFSYQEADIVLSLYFDKKISTTKIIKMGYKNAKKIISHCKKNSFKEKTPYKIVSDKTKRI